ncbi:MAG: hypothetical protein EKK29_10095 [Hyphomicrobiales bacterium]|nr:MAG: hypothetical protein EKK29_10095 [Hyphomicrobiales bacterium]
MTDSVKIPKQEKYRRGLMEAKRQAKRIPELEAEIAELRRQLAERTDTPAQSSQIDKLSPVARAEFDLMHSGAKGTFKDKVGDDALVYLAEFYLLHNAKRRREKAAAMAKARQEKKEAEADQDEYLAHMEQRRKDVTQKPPEGELSF